MHYKYQADQALIQGRRNVKKGTMGIKAMQGGEMGAGGRGIQVCKGARSDMKMNN